MDTNPGWDAKPVINLLLVLETRASVKSQRHAYTAKNRKGKADGKRTRICTKAAHDELWTLEKVKFIVPREDVENKHFKIELTVYGVVLVFEGAEAVRGGLNVRLREGVILCHS